MISEIPDRHNHNANNVNTSVDSMLLSNIVSNFTVAKQPPNKPKSFTHTQFAIYLEVATHFRIIDFMQFIMMISIQILKITPTFDGPQINISLH